MDRERRTLHARTWAFRTQAGVVASRRGGTLVAGQPPHGRTASFGGGWQCLVGMKCPVSSWEAHQSPRSKCAEMPGKDVAPGPRACTAGVVGTTGQHCHPSRHLVGLLGEKWHKTAINLREQASFSHTGSSPFHISEPAGRFHVIFGITVEKTVRH